MVEIFIRKVNMASNYPNCTAVPSPWKSGGGNNGCDGRAYHLFECGLDD